MTPPHISSGSLSTGGVITAYSSWVVRGGNFVCRLVVEGINAVMVKGAPIQPHDLGRTEPVVGINTDNGDPNKVIEVVALLRWKSKGKARLKPAGLKIPAPLRAKLTNHNSRKSAHAIIHNY